MAVTNYMTVNGQIRSEHRSGEAKSRDYLHDHLGNIVAVFQNDWMVGVCTYDPSGEFLSNWQMSSYKFAWNGGLGVRSTGLEWSSHYGRARHYSFMDGRFTTSWKRKGYNFNLQAVMAGMKRGFGGSIVAQSSQWTPRPQQPAQPGRQRPSPANTGPTAPSQTGGNELPAQPSGRIFRDRDLSKYGKHYLSFANCLACCLIDRLSGKSVSVFGLIASMVPTGDCSSGTLKPGKMPGLDIPRPEFIPEDVWEAMVEEWKSGMQGMSYSTGNDRLDAILGNKKLRDEMERAMDMYAAAKKAFGKCSSLFCEINCTLDLMIKMALEDVNVEQWQFCGLMPDEVSCQACCESAFDTWSLLNPKKGMCYSQCAGI